MSYFILARTKALESRLKSSPLEVQARYRDALDLSWIGHDSALEGTVYTAEELSAAIQGSPEVTGEPDARIEQIRRHREALSIVRYDPRQPLTVDYLRMLHRTLHPKNLGRFRTVVAEHRSPPAKIERRLEVILEWAHRPTENPLGLASRTHYDICRTAPFPNDSGIIARLVLTQLLLASGYPPAIIPSTERVRYYEALQGKPGEMMALVTESMENTLHSIERLLG